MITKYFALVSSELARPGKSFPATLGQRTLITLVQFLRQVNCYDLSKPRGIEANYPSMHCKSLQNS